MIKNIRTFLAGLLIAAQVFGTAFAATMINPANQIANGTLPAGVIATNATNLVGYSTVASAATPDIWTGTGNVISYTGTATATGFAAAPSVGAQRKLMLTGAASFTTGANLIVEGLPSGMTFTLAANDEVDVIALSTTQFKLAGHFLDIGHNQSWKSYGMDLGTVYQNLTPRPIQLSLLFNNATASSSRSEQILVNGATAMVFNIIQGYDLNPLSITIPAGATYEVPNDPGYLVLASAYIFN